MSTRIQIIILAALVLVFALMIFHINKKKLDFAPVRRKILPSVDAFYTGMYNTYLFPCNS